jgi:hypothetical protein
MSWMSTPPRCGQSEETLILRQAQDEREPVALPLVLSLSKDEPTD